MYEIDFNTPIHVHFIGIGGISMSGLAQVLLSKGFTVSGSDNLKSALTEELSKAGAEIYIGQRASNISENIDLVVYTAAIHEDNPEFACAKEKGMEEVVGPLGFSDLEREGLLVEGFDQLSTFEEQYNYPYYKKLIENGFDIELVAFELNIPIEEIIECKKEIEQQRINEIISRRNKEAHNKMRKARKKYQKLF